MVKAKVIRLKTIFCFLAVLIYSFLPLENVFAADDDEAVSASEYMSWGIEAMGLNEIVAAINQKSDVPEILVAVIDTGVNEAVFHERFPNRHLDSYCVATCEEGMVDEVGHGTRVISTIAEGTADNVNLLMIRASATPTFTVTDLINSVNYAVSQGADVINISAGNPFYFDNDDYNEDYEMTWGEIYQLVWEIEKDVIDGATESGAIIVGAAGNDGDNEYEHYPASYDSAISVGAVNEDKERANFSNYNEYLDFVAPGVMIYGLNAFYTGGEDEEITSWGEGTSMAAPHITAAIADLLSFNKGLTMNEIVEILRLKAIDLGDEGRDDYYGYGFPDFSGEEFCLDNMYCDEFRVFRAEAPENQDDPDTPEEPGTSDESDTTDGPDIPVPNTAEKEVKMPNSGQFSHKNDNFAIVSTPVIGFILTIIIVVILAKKAKV